MKKVFYLLLILLSLGSSLFAQKKSSFYESLFLDIGMGPSYYLASKHGVTEGGALSLALTYKMQEGFYGGINCQFIGFTEDEGQTFLGFHGGKEFVVYRSITADVGAGLSLMNYDLGSLINDIDYLTDEEAENGSNWEGSYLNASFQAALTFKPHDRSPFYIKTGAFINFNSGASTQGLLFTLGIRLGKW